MWQTAADGKGNGCPVPSLELIGVLSAGSQRIGHQPNFSRASFSLSHIISLSLLNDKDKEEEEMGEELSVEEERS